MFSNLTLVSQTVGKLREYTPLPIGLGVIRAPFSYLLITWLEGFSQVSWLWNNDSKLGLRKGILQSLILGEACVYLEPRVRLTVLVFCKKVKNHYLHIKNSLEYHLWREGKKTTIKLIILRIKLIQTIWSVLVNFPCWRLRWELFQCLTVWDTRIIIHIKFKFNSRNK